MDITQNNRITNPVLCLLLTGLFIAGNLCAQESGCFDGLDNDSDGLVDCDDIDCILAPGCMSVTGSQMGWQPVIPDIGYNKAVAIKYTGYDQWFTVPCGIDTLNIKTWAAGGGGEFTDETGYGVHAGGAGGYSYGKLHVSPGQLLVLMVGEGGIPNSPTPTYGFGGSGNPTGSAPGASGGGATGIFLGNIAQANALIMAGGGGGAPYGGGNSGGAGGGNTGSSPTPNNPVAPLAGGGTQTAGGMGSVGGICNASTVGEDGIAMQGGMGGSSLNNGGGGGGGYYGGGGGGGDCDAVGSASDAGGGGGSGYIGHPELFNGISIAGSDITPPNQSDIHYLPGVGTGGPYSDNGGHGLIILQWNDSALSSSMPEILMQDTCNGNITYFALANTTGLDSVIWNFGDPASGLDNTSTEITPEHIYSNPGTYSVQVITYNSCGNDTGIRTLTIVPTPETSFTFQNQCLGNPVTFTDNTSILQGNYIVTLWEFGDNTTSIQQNPNHNYASAGTYTVTLVTTSDNGCYDTSNQQIEIYELPEAGFTFQDTCQGLSIPFTDNSSGTAFWHWNFGDNTSSTLQNPSHVYLSNGTYTITQIVTSWSGCSDTLSATITIYPTPVANFKPDTVCLHDSTQFTDLSTISSGSIVNWVWNFGDGTPVTNQQHPVHYFPLGDHYVTLTAVSNEGCVNTIAKKVGVYPLPVAAFNYSNACLNEQPAQFYDSSTILSGTVAQWQWNFNPGAAYNSNPSHTYTDAGTYAVELIVTSDKGCMDTVQQQIEIYPAPVADFTADTTAGCEPLCVDFTDQSTITNGTIASWNYIFGNGTSSASVPDATTCFSSPGTYSVSLIVTSNKGCKDTTIKSDYITVYPLPVADFSFSPETTTVQDMNFVFTDLSAGTISKWDWLFFDNDSLSSKGISSLQHPSFNFATVPANPIIFFQEDTGYYPVQLIVTTTNGCKDTITKKVKIEGVFYVNIPNAFTPDGDGINDFFFPSGIGIKPDADFKFYVFDRWGDLIYESHNLGKPWDGFYKGKIVQQDVYVWMIKLKDILDKEHKYIGRVTVLYQR